MAHCGRKPRKERKRAEEIEKRRGRATEAMAATTEVMNNCETPLQPFSPAPVWLPSRKKSSADTQSD